MDFTSNQTSKRDVAIQIVTVLASLARLSRRHDVLAIQISDPAERQLPNVGMLVLQDAETGEQILLDGNDIGFRQRFEAVGLATRFRSG